jgi:hypothetical protein
MGIKMLRSDLNTLCFECALFVLRKTRNATIALAHAHWTLGKWFDFCDQYDISHIHTASLCSRGVQSGKSDIIYMYKYSLSILFPFGMDFLTE